MEYGIEQFEFSDFSFDKELDTKLYNSGILASHSCSIY